MEIKKYNNKNFKIKKYKIKFNDYQKHIFDNIDVNGHKRHYLMSVMSYLIKYSNKDGLVLKSLSKLFAMYKRYHKKVNSFVDSISKAYFCKLVNELVDLKLLTKDKRKVFIFKNEVDKKVDKKVDKNNSTPSIEESEVSEDFEDTQISNLNSLYYNYNIYNTSGEDVDYTYNDFDSSKRTDTSTVFVANIGDTLATRNQLEEIAEDLYKSLRIKSRHIKTEVTNIIWRYSGTIYLHAARSYLKTVILDKKLKRDREREEFAKEYIYTKNITRNNRYITGGSNYLSNNNKRLRQIAGLNNEWGNYISNNSQRLDKVNSQNFNRKQKEYEYMENDLLGWYYV